MKLPRGRLVRSRVVSDPGTALRTALDRSLTGYVVLEPQDTLLLDSEAKGVLTFEDGVPVLAYHTGTDRGGPSALADLAIPGPYRTELFELPGSALAEIHDVTSLRVPPGMAAERLAGDPALATRTRRRAPDRAVERTREPSGDSVREPGPVEAFLADDEKIDAIRRQAREEAHNRAKEWGLGDQLE